MVFVQVKLELLRSREFELVTDHAWVQVSVPARCITMRFTETLLLIILDMRHERGMACKPAATLALERLQGSVVLCDFRW